MQHRKEKPWDHDGIDHWVVPKFTKEDNPTGILEESSFAVLFPKYRGMKSQCRLLCNFADSVCTVLDTFCPAEKYLREVWPAVTRSLKEVGIGCELNLVSCSMCCNDINPDNH